jgi:hypothetical protein
VKVCDGSAALEPREHLRRRLAPGHPVRAVRADEHGETAAGFGQSLEQRGARRVRPVQVVEDCDGRARLRDIGEDRLGRVQAVFHRTLRVGDDREQFRVLGVPPHDVEHEGEGTAEGAGICLAGDDPGVREASQQLAYEPGLADPGLATDQRDCRRAVLTAIRVGNVGEPGEAIELCGPTNHDRAQARTPDEHWTSVRSVSQSGPPAATACRSGAPGDGWRPSPTTPGAPQPVSGSDTSWNA